MKNLAIIGSSDLGQLIAYHAKQSGYTPVGFFDDFKETGALIDGLPVLGSLQKVKELYDSGLFDCLMMGVGYKHMPARRSLFERYASTIEFANIIHPSSYIDPSCRLGKGIFVLPGCTVDRNVCIGNNVVLNTGCIIAHDTCLGDHSFLSPAVNVAGFTKIGQSCVLGIGTTIIDNIAIHDHTQTAGGAVITRNLIEPGLYAGVPAVIKRRAHNRAAK